MRRPRPPAPFGTASLAWLFLFCIAATSRSEALVSLSAEGWSVTANPDRGVFSISHEVLGTLLEDAFFEVRDSGGTHTIRRWTAAQGAPNQLMLRSVEFRTGYVIELRRDVLIISSTSRTSTLRAAVPVSQSFIQARLLDPQGTPVNWIGNNEVEGLYGGHQAATTSFLPRTNSDIIYFSLGHITSPAFHSLFDRQSDTAIDFPQGAVLEQSTRSPDWRELIMPVPGSAAIRITRDYYTHTLNVPYYVPFDDHYFPTAPLVWSSWTSYYEDVREEDIVRNTDWLAANLKPYGFGYVELDDGYDRIANGAHSWISGWNERAFPHGPEWLAHYIKSKGLHAGLWLVPNSYAAATQIHPDWYLRDKKGQFVLDYSTPALDSTNPAVLEHLRHLFSTLGSWGFEYYKFDGEHSVPQYAPIVDTTRLHQPEVDLLENYRERLRTIRDTVGPTVFLEGCPAGTPLNGIGYFNSYFNGDDLYANWQGMYPLFSSITANGFLNHIVVYVMPGEGLELGERESLEAAAAKRSPVVIQTAREREEPTTGIGTTLPEARTLVSYVALTGVVYPVASVMPELPEERVQLLKATMPTMPILPMDLFSRGTDAIWDKFKHVTPDYYVHNYPDVLDLKVNAAAGAFDIVALTNWRSVPQKQRVNLEAKLGLPGGKPYVVFDFWNQKEIGVIDQALEADIEPHDTRVLFVHPLLDRPQLVGMSRHISGTYSIQKLEWIASQHRLDGRSDAPTDATYTLWIHLPQGMHPTRFAAHAGTRDIAITHNLNGRSLAIRFQGQHEPVDWEVEFTSSMATK
jgi:melibiase-like protein/alpha galactosidase C-like protein